MFVRFHLRSPLINPLDFRNNRDRTLGEPRDDRIRSWRFSFFGEMTVSRFLGFRGSVAGVSKGDVVVDGMGRGETNVIAEEFLGI